MWNIKHPIFVGVVTAGAVVRTAACGAVVLLICVFQAVIRPLLIGACKFRPSCSDYAVEAVLRHGPWRGSGYALRRLLRCHPFTPGGIDPVPDHVDSFKR